MTKWLASRSLKAKRYNSPEICRNTSDIFFSMIGLETAVLDSCGDGAPRLFAAVEKTVAAYTGGRHCGIIQAGKPIAANPNFFRSNMKEKYR